MTQTDFEKNIYTFWEKQKLFSADPNSKKKPYSLLIPPPNLTGELHLGHAMQHSILDALARFKRLQGFDVLLLPGVDHAGIQFETTLDKILSKEGLTKEKLGREKWLEKAWGFKEEVYRSVSGTWRFMGLSADWEKEVFTLDEGPRKAVFFEFKTFWDKGLIYKGPYIVQWCPKCNTAIEDVEMEYEERKENLYFVKYRIKEHPNEFITVATTRPETIFADVAIAVYPNHPKYKKFIGNKAWNPLGSPDQALMLKIIEDKRVDKNFGTGALKITPGHDFLDYQIGKEHNLPILNVINKEGRLTGIAGKFSGMKVLEAREAVVSELKGKDMLTDEKDYVHNVAVCERCKSIVEPLISEEWFVKVEDLAKGAIEVIEKSEIRFLPGNYAKILKDWLLNIHDWCISRNLWWGHRIPVWYCLSANKVKDKMGFAGDVVPQVLRGKTKTYRLRNHKFQIEDVVAFKNSEAGQLFGWGVIEHTESTTIGKLPLDDIAHGAIYKKRSELIAAFRKHYPDRDINDETPVFVYTYKFIRGIVFGDNLTPIIVSQNKPKACPICKKNKFMQDEQVLDTWFSSGLWPMSTLGWPFVAKAPQGKPSKRPNLDPNLAKYFPWDFEITAPEIKYLWIARMIMITKYFTDQIPFKTMFFHGMLRDLQGRKFSKSLGNGIEPNYLIKNWGTDATRMALYTYAVPGRDGRVSKEILDERGKNYRNFATKLRNIGRFVLELKASSSNVILSASEESQDPSWPKANQDDKKGHDDDKWIKQELEKTIKNVTKNLKDIQLHLASDEIYNFVWHTFADIYIEKSKKRRGEAQPVLEYVLKQSLILLHPFMPFVTEEIYQKFDSREKSIMLETWPPFAKASEG